MIAQPCYPNIKYSHQTPDELHQLMKKILETKDFDDLTDDDDEEFCKETVSYSFTLIRDISHISTVFFVWIIRKFRKN